MPAEEKVLREGSAKKRADILAAARSLFLEEGFDRASVDAVSARAGVSKRTVYDYFGDKQNLLVAVLRESGMLLLDSIRDAIDEHLTEVTDLEGALTGFAVQITTMTMGSTDYRDLIKLVSTESLHLPGGAVDQWLGDEPEDAVAERFAELGRLGMLDVPDPRLAADHFIALTIEAVIGGYTSQRLTGGEANDKIVAGVRVFLRAYTPR
jgi:TetR/AcrR family transcriptional repressor of mexJK operon